MTEPAASSSDASAAPPSAPASAAPGGTRGLSWQPRRWTFVTLAVAAGFTLYFFQPGLWVEVGGDSKVFYTAANLAASGGDPYDPAEIGREADLILNNPAHLHLGQPNFLAPASYAYPPVWTRLIELGRGLPWLAFYLIGALLMLACAFAALELLMGAIGWRDRRLARVALLISTPLATTVFDWNPSALVMLIWAGGFALLSRRRWALAGLVLSLATFKLALGLPVALALLVAGVPGAIRDVAGGSTPPSVDDPGGDAAPGAARRFPNLGAAIRCRAIALAAFLAGSVLLLGLNVLIARPGEMAAWIGSMASLGGRFANELNGARSPYAQTLLAGLPAMGMERIGTPAATALSILLVLALLAWAATRRGAIANVRAEPLLLPATLTAAAMVVIPYTHNNDLLLDALPLLVACSLPGRRWTRLVPLVWYAGPPARFAEALAAGILFGVNPNGKAGWGVAISSATLLALAVYAALPPAEAEPGP